MGIRRLLAGLWALMFAVCHSLTAAEFDPLPETTEVALVASSFRLVAFHVGELAKRKLLCHRKVGTQGEVDAARARLAIARYNACLASGEEQAASEQLRIIVHVTERELRREQDLRQSLAASEVSLVRVQRQLAHARSLLAERAGDRDRFIEEVRAGIAMWTSELDRLRELHRRRALAAGDLEAAECCLAYASYRLAKAEGNSDGAVAELQAMLGLHEKNLARLTEVQRRARVPQMEVAVARRSVAEARLRIAIFQQQHADVVEELRGLVALDQELLQLERNRSRLVAAPANWQEWALLQWQWQLDLDRHRLAKAIVGEYIEVEPPGTW